MALAQLHSLYWAGDGAAPPAVTTGGYPAWQSVACRAAVSLFLILWC